MSLELQPSRQRRSHRVFLLGSVGLAALIATAACSSPSGPGVASISGHHASAATSAALTQAQSDQAMLDFARCLRSHGIDEPDPAHIPGHSGLSIQIPPRTSATAAALDACNHFMQPVVQAKQGAQQQITAELPALTRYAECMRAHDISMLDPNPEGALNLGQVPGITSDFGRYSRQFQAADTACRGLLPASVHDDGTGP